MVHFLNKITESLNVKKHTGTISIFCDLKKAFDTCKDEILFLKLKKNMSSLTQSSNGLYLI